MRKRIFERLGTAWSGLIEVWLSWAGAFIVICIFVALAIGASGGWEVLMSWLGSDKASGWVQAIGSILAIFVAIATSAFQFQSAVHLQEKASIGERLRKQEVLLVLVEAALEEFRGSLKALRSDDPLGWFKGSSAIELMKEYHDSFSKFAPLDMPSAAAVRSLITLRDRLQAALWNVDRALTHGAAICTDSSKWADALRAANGTPLGDNYGYCIEAMEDNLREVEEELAALRAETPAV